MDSRDIFSIDSTAAFNEAALALFEAQYRQVPLYRDFCQRLDRVPPHVRTLADIPFLPIQFFKSHKVLYQDRKPETVFLSSGTTGTEPSRHYVSDLALYRRSFTVGFHREYGAPENYSILALLPSYSERPGSSLIFMVEDLIRRSGHPESGFISGEAEELARRIQAADAGPRPVLLIGVSFALLDLARQAPMQLTNTLVMETGGMKGRRKEWVREALHAELGKGFGVDRIHSEYGMTELLSQAYSKGSGSFRTPPWMQVLMRDTEDPLAYQDFGRTGGINVIDLANRYSCAFIATQDLGKAHTDGSFEVLGRFDHSDIRGCNLMAL